MSGNQQYISNSSSSYPNQSLNSTVEAPSGQTLLIKSVSATNGIAGVNQVGLFNTITNSQFKVFQLLAGGDVEITEELQDEAASSIFSTSNNDGVLFQAKDKFNLVTFNISQAATGSPVFTYKYWNGSSYATLNLLNTPLYSGTGIVAIVFDAPIDWVAGDGSENADNSFYSIQVIATTAPSQAVQINEIKIGKLLKYSSYVEEGASVNINYEDDPYLLQSGEHIIPFFSYASVSNRLDIEYKINP